MKYPRRVSVDDALPCTASRRTTPLLLARAVAALTTRRRSFFPGV